MKVFTHTLVWFVLTSFSLFLSGSVTADETDAVEKISVINSVRLNALNDVLTSNNVIVFPEQTVSLDRTVADIIVQTVGVELNGQGGLFQSYNVRGFSRDRIKTFVNGIPIITDRRAGNSASFIPTELVNNIYIQKGPSATLYGSSAMGGVVNLSTLSDVNKISVDVQPKAHQIAAQYTNGQLNFGGVYRNADNSSSPTSQENSNQLNNGYQQSAITLSTEQYWQNIQINASSIFSYGSDLGKSAITFPDSRVSLYPQDKHLLSQIQLSDNESWKLQVFQHMQKWQSDVTRIESGEAVRRNVTDYSSNTYGLDANYVIEQTKVGVDWYARRNIEIIEQEFNSAGEIQWSKPLVAANEQSLGLYVNHVWSLATFNFTAGGRIDYVSLSSDASNADKDISKAALSASLSTHYRLNDSTNIEAEIASSFRFPTVSELLFSGETPRGTTIGNAELEPEESIGYQLSLSHNFSSTLTSSLSAYLYNINNYIERVTRADQSRTFKNTDSVQIKGIEFTTNWQPNEQFNTSIGLQWQQGKNTLNQTVDDSLPAAIKWAFQWDPPHKTLAKFSINNSINYRLSKNNAGPSEVYLTNALLWNTSFSYEWSQRIRMSFSVNNVLNENYKATADEDAAFQPERTAGLQLKWFY